MLLEQAMIKSEKDSVHDSDRPNCMSPSRPCLVLSEPAVTKVMSNHDVIAFCAHSSVQRLVTGVLACPDSTQAPRSMPGRS